MQLVKVSANSQPKAVAGAIAGIVRDHDQVAVQAVGASAVNQAIKAIAISLDFLKDDHIDAVCVPEMVNVITDGREITVLRLVVEPRSGSTPDGVDGLADSL